jgi:hypothetical protein
MPGETNIKESFGTITSKALDEMTGALGIDLPADYRKFVLAHDGVKFERSTFSFVEGKHETESGVRALYSWLPHPHYHNRKPLQLMGLPGFPPGVLPIGEDPGGNLICLVVAGKKKGQVCFWDQDRFGEDDPWVAMSLVAPSFTAFVKGLY